MQFNLQYYLDAIELYEKELERAKRAGITINFNRIDQFKVMWEERVITLEQWEADHHINPPRQSYHQGE